MMKSMVKVTSILAVLALVVGMALPVMATTTTSNVKDILLNALHEERLAAATYQAVLDKFGDVDGVEPFERILQAEKTHIAAVENLLKINNIEIPENDVKATAPESVEEAYKLAIEIEKEDIALYEEKLIPETEDTMMKTVFTRLANASKNHLEAFEAYAKGETPEAQQNGQKMYGVANRNANGRGRWNDQQNAQGQATMGRWNNQQNMQGQRANVTNRGRNQMNQGQQLRSRDGKGNNCVGMANGRRGNNPSRKGHRGHGNR